MKGISEENNKVKKLIAKKLMKKFSKEVNNGNPKN